MIKLTLGQGVQNFADFTDNSTISGRISAGWCVWETPPYL